MKTHGWDSVKLSDAYTMEELETLRQQVIKEHANQRIGGVLRSKDGLPTINEIDQKGMVKLSALAYAVHFKLKELKP